MIRMLEERNRILALTARAAGLVVTAAAIALLCLPGTLPPFRLILALALLALVAVALLRLPAWDVRWPVLVLSASLACLLVIGMPSHSPDGRRWLPGLFDGGPDLAAHTAATHGFWMVAGAVASSSVGVLLTSPRRRLVAATGAALSLTAAVALPALHGVDAGPTAGTVLLVWLAATLVVTWLLRVIPRAFRRIQETSRVYAIQRQASEAEAQRRQGARLLHDTVLATLTLLAHSGVGVNESALRQQAAEDAALLRQLRLGHTPQPVSSADYKLQPVEQSDLGNTLESVKQRFNRMGLEVAWHGAGHVLLPSETLDAFLLALAECLENVRRHSGVSKAHVTITEDAAMVRAMVTDGGKGFEPSTVGDKSLGVAESIVARLHDVDGRARVFSAPGSGTTVVLEVPK